MELSLLETHRALMMVQQLSCNMSDKECEKRGIEKLVSIKSWASCGVDPALMGTGLIPLLKKL